jgi:hypothetical protein
MGAEIFLCFRSTHEKQGHNGTQADSGGLKDGLIAEL